MFIPSLIIRPKLRKTQVHRVTPKWPWTLRGQRYPHICWTTTRKSKFYSVLQRSMITRFPDNWGVFFLHRVSVLWWIWNLRKKIRTQHFKYPQNNFVRTIEKIIQKKSDKLRLLFVEVVLMQKYHWHSDCIRLHLNRYFCGVMVRKRVSWYIR